MSNAVESIRRKLLEDDIALPMGYCLSCHKDVVAYGRLGEGSRAGKPVWCCLFCNEELVLEDASIQLEPAQKVLERGFDVFDPDHPEGASGKGSSCSNGGCNR